MVICKTPNLYPNDPDYDCRVFCDTCEKEIKTDSDMGQSDGDCDICLTCFKEQEKEDDDLC